MVDGKKKSKSDPVTKTKKPRKKAVDIAEKSVNVKKNITKTIKNLSPSPLSSDSSNTSSPAFLLIPLNGGGKGKHEKELSIEDAINFPVGSNISRLKNPPEKKESRIKRKSSLSVKIDKAREKIVEYEKKQNKIDIQKYPLTDQILLMDMDLDIKSTILKKIQDNEKSKSSYDQSKFMNWVKDILQLPFNKFLPLPISVLDGSVKIKKYLENVSSQLDDAIAGQNEAKEEIIDFIARLISNPEGRGNILALEGPKGTGKTRLVRKGVAAALDRPFHAINLGGLNDVHVLTGHDMTYSGAKYGRIAQILIQSDCNNPVIYLDEIDKIQATDKGMEIFRVLTHILDEEQNHEFFDEYFAGVKIDLSKILFVASLNNPEDVESVLRDRLKLIHVKELDFETKENIVVNYILPELCKEVGMEYTSLSISQQVIKYIINVKTEPEEGCRQLKKNMQTIVQKLNTQRLIKSGIYTSQENENDAIAITETIVDQLLKKHDHGKYPHHIYN